MVGAKGTGGKPTSSLPGSGGGVACESFRGELEAGWTTRERGERGVRHGRQHTLNKSLFCGVFVLSTS